MSGLYVPLDVEYFTDEEFIECGPLAEVLYIRSLCFIKRKLLDGKIKRSQLVAFSAGIPDPEQHAERLVEVGLWRKRADGWFVPAYLKRNSSKADIETAKELARQAGIRGNHERWHIGPEGKPSPKCPLCRSEFIGSPDRGAKRGRSPKTTPEPETEPTPKATPTPEPSSSPSTSLRSDPARMEGIIRNLFPRVEDIA